MIQEQSTFSQNATRGMLSWFKEVTASAATRTLECAHPSPVSAADGTWSRTGTAASEALDNREMGTPAPASFEGSEAMTGGRPSL